MTTHIHASCHCGNLQSTLTTDQQPGDMWLRACQCSFCRSHNMRSLSDPAGHLEVRVRDESLLNRYRFGLKTIDFLICKSCGNYIGAVQQIGERTWGIMNANLTEGRGERFGEAEHRFYEDESADERTARRKKVWTPGELVIEGKASA
tara:strand:- start:70 stop:513 length:444 start_codon:yes stop_codon:yes gene_type:complete